MDVAQRRVQRLRPIAARLESGAADGGAGRAARPGRLQHGAVAPRGARLSGPRRSPGGDRGAAALRLPDALSGAAATLRGGGAHGRGRLRRRRGGSTGQPAAQPARLQSSGWGGLPGRRPERARRAGGRGLLPGHVSRLGGKLEPARQPYVRDPGPRAERARTGGQGRRLGAQLSSGRRLSDRDGRGGRIQPGPALPPGLRPRLRLHRLRPRSRTGGGGRRLGRRNPDQARHAVPSGQLGAGVPAGRPAALAHRLARRREPGRGAGA
ncbi:hypothetical protein D3C80_1151140 [compost metagenome]